MSSRVQRGSYLNLIGEPCGDSTITLIDPSRRNAFTAGRSSSRMTAPPHSDRRVEVLWPVIAGPMAESQGLAAKRGLPFNDPSEHERSRPRVSQAIRPVEHEGAQHSQIVISAQPVLETLEGVAHSPPGPPCRPSNTRTWYQWSFARFASHERPTGRNPPRVRAARCEPSGSRGPRRSVRLWTSSRVPRRLAQEKRWAGMSGRVLFFVSGGLDAPVRQATT